MSTKVDHTLSELDNLSVRAGSAIESASSIQDLDQVRVKFLGKAGEIKGLMKLLGEGGLSAEDRKKFGQMLNTLRDRLERELGERRAQLEQALLKANAGLDVSLPGRRHLNGHIHPLTETSEEMKKILTGMGFSYDDYPDIESEYYNFDALNTPSWHPARDMHDTFYVDDTHVLRTHTSAFQVRVLEACQGSLPLRAMTTGRCYRRDEIDASHSPIFQQLDGIAVGRNLRMTDLKWTLSELAKELFGKSTLIRFRPSFFPFTTPSAEVDVSCIVCRQKGCHLCRRTGWLEVLGSGMMRPEVLRAGGIDPDAYQGFAFGIGVDRIAMLRYQISDIRLLYTNEEAFLRQF